MTAVDADRTDRVDRPAALGWFLAGAVGWSWGLWGLASWLDPGGGLGEALTIAGRFGPSLAAIVVVSALTGRRGIGRLLASLRRWRAPAHLWAITILGPPAVVLAAIAVASAWGTPPGEFNDPATAYLAVPAFIVILIVGGPLGEELGWRGFALDRLQARLSPVTASLVLGVVWGLWHLPLFLDPGQVQHGLPLGIYLGQTITTAVVYTWLWNITRSLPIVLVLHTMTNLAAGVFPLLRPDAPNDTAFTAAVALAGAGAVALVVVTRGRLGRDTDAVR